jgi:hypothetical protein
MGDSNTVKIYDALVASFPDVVRKGKTTPYTSSNTYMFSFIGKDGNLALRLSLEEIESFIKKHDARLMTQHGKVLKDFICVPDNVINDMPLLKQYFKLSLDHTNSLKPKKK